MRCGSARGHSVLTFVHENCIVHGCGKLEDFGVGIKGSMLRGEGRCLLLLLRLLLLHHSMGMRCLSGPLLLLLLDLFKPLLELLLWLLLVLGPLLKLVPLVKSDIERLRMLVLLVLVLVRRLIIHRMRASRCCFAPTPISLYPAPSRSDRIVFADFAAPLIHFLCLSAPPCVQPCTDKTPQEETVGPRLSHRSHPHTSQLTARTPCSVSDTHA